MPTGERQRDLRDFRAFLREHHYAPQGRLARAGDLEDHDLDAMLRGALPPVWHWIFRHVRSERMLEVTCSHCTRYSYVALARAA